MLRVRAHRKVWILLYGEIPDGLDVLHHCDNPICVRPNHLFLGTNADNMHDKAAKGRVRHSLAKLTPEQVLEIRAKAATATVSHSMLAREYGVEQTAISRIVRRDTWKNI